MHFDPETIEGDYGEGWQLWYHYFNCAPKATKQCFKDSFLVPFVSKFDPYIEAKGVELMMNRFKRLLEEWDKNA